VRSTNNESGAILAIVIIFMFALTITGLAFLNSTVMEYRLAMREVHKTQAFYLADGGIEYLLVKLHNEEKPDLIPWTDLEDGDYKVIASYDATPAYAISTGRIIKRGQEILKRIKVTISESSVFDYAIFGEHGIEISGNTFIGSINGKASIGTNSKSEESPYAINVEGNPTIDANVAIGPEGDIAAAINASETVIPPENRSTLGEPRYMPEVDLPDWVGTTILIGDYTVKGPENISDILFDTDAEGNLIGHFGSLHILATGDELVIDQDCVLVIGYLEIRSQGGIYINPSKNLTIYVTQNADIGGNGIVNPDEDSTLLHIYGTDSCESINFSGTENFYGAVYAREAEITVSGTADIVGSLIGDTVDVGGNPNVRWDPALGQDGGPVFTNLTNWEELP